MTGIDLSDMTDEELVNHFHRGVLRLDSSFADVERNNRIDETELMPCFKILASRGGKSARKLATLASDSNPNVRLKAAVYAFEFAPDTCRHVLQEMTKRRDVFAVFAWAALCRMDPSAAPPASALLANTEGAGKK